LTVLVLALATLFLANALVPTPGGLLVLVLLLLGTGTGLVGYLCDARGQAKEHPDRPRISPRGWVSLGLLTLATGVLALNQIQAWTAPDVADSQLARAAKSEAAAREDLAALRRQLAEKEKQLKSLDFKTADDRRGAWDYLPDSPGPYRPADRDNPRGADLPERLAQRDTEHNRNRSGRSDDGPTVVDLEDDSRKPRRESNDRTHPADNQRTRLEKEVEQLKDQLRQKEARLKGKKSSSLARQPTTVNLPSWNGHSRGRYAGGD
jgi:hypothetical protein